MPAKALGPTSDSLTYQPDDLEQVTSLSLFFFVCKVGLIIVGVPSLAPKCLPRTVSPQATSPILVSK